MSWTKRQFVTQAFEEIGYASYSYDLEPEQLQAGLRRLDSMMATWNGRGIALGYPLPSTPEDSNLDTETEVPDFANEAIYTNLAVRIAPIIGKIVSIETKVAAKMSYNEVLRSTSVTHEMKFPTSLPAGAGNKPWRNDSPFIQPEDDSIVTPPDNEVNFNG